MTFVQDVLFGLFGAGDSSASRVSAASWYSLTQSLLSGLAAGLVVFFVLRRHGRCTGPGTRSPAPARDCCWSSARG